MAARRSNPKTAIILDTRRKKNDNNYPVKLRVTFERKQQYYPTSFSLSKDEFDRALFGQRQTEAEKKLKKGIQAYEDKAVAIIEKMPLFAWDKFEKRYFTNRAAKDTLSQAFTDYAVKLRSESRIGTAVSYECSQSSLNKYKSGARFTDVTPAFLSAYEKWMLDEGNSITTVGIYLRNLRSLLNTAIADGLLEKEAYPFGKRRYEIPTGQNIKKALTLSDIKAIYNYQPEPGSMAALCRDYWLFMYFCNGLNVKDLCLLRQDSIKGNVMEFVRAKTVRTKRKVEAIRVPLNDDSRAIIERWGNPPDSYYLFPVLTTGLTPERERNLIQQRTSLINDHMKAIAATLGIERDCTTYYARHSFASILQRSGAPISFISEALGHGNVTTTQSYLAGFEDEQKAETLKALVAFKKLPEDPQGSLLQSVTG